MAAALTLMQSCFSASSSRYALPNRHRHRRPPSPLATVSTPAQTPTFTKIPSPSFSPASLPSAPTPTLSAPSSPPPGVTTCSSADTFPPAGASVASMPGSGASSLFLGPIASSIASFAAGALMFV